MLHLAYRIPSLGLQDNLQKWHFLLQKSAQIPVLYQTLAKMGKNDNFLDFAKQRLFKKLLWPPPFWPKIGVLNLSSLKPETIHVEQKTQHKNWKKTKNMAKEIERKTKTKKTPKQQWLIKTLKLNTLMWLFYETKAKKQNKKTRKQTKNTIERNQEGRREKK